MCLPSSYLELPILPRFGRKIISTLISTLVSTINTIYMTSRLADLSQTTSSPDPVNKIPSSATTCATITVTTNFSELVS